MPQARGDTTSKLCMSPAAHRVRRFSLRRASSRRTTFDPRLHYLSQPFTSTRLPCPRGNLACSLPGYPSYPAPLPLHLGRLLHRNIHNRAPCLILVYHFAFQDTLLTSSCSRHFSWVHIRQLQRQRRTHSVTGIGSIPRTISNTTTFKTLAFGTFWRPVLRI